MDMYYPIKCFHPRSWQIAVSERNITVSKRKQIYQEIYIQALIQHPSCFECVCSTDWWIIRYPLEESFIGHLKKIYLYSCMCSCVWFYLDKSIQTTVENTIMNIKSIFIVLIWNVICPDTLFTKRKHTLYYHPSYLFLRTFFTWYS